MAGIGGISCNVDTKKAETIKLIDQLYQSGSISKQQAGKLKAEAINN